MKTDAPAWSHLLNDPSAFVREDEAEDTVFYARERLIQHLDRYALETVERLVEHLIVEDAPDVLDLMASFDSHLPMGLEAGRVAGLGLNEAELLANPVLTERAVHDLNQDPVLPYADESFDLVLNVVSIAYVTRPAPLFAEVARVLRPGGLFLVVFSNRSFPTKEIRLWELLAEDERPELVATYFRRTGGFGEPRTWMSLGGPRPEDDRHAGCGVPSDPVFAVWAETPGAAPDRPARRAPDVGRPVVPPDLVRARLASIPETGACPYCEEPLRIWAISEHPMSTWDHDLLVCTNDTCPYVVGGWEAMFRQGMPGHTTRFCYDPQSGSRIAISVPNLSVIRDALR